MSIFGPSWASGDQITRTKQADMVADGINTIDDIHPQYRQSFLSKALYSFGFGVPGGFDYRFVDIVGGASISNERYVAAASTYLPLVRIQYKVLAPLSDPSVANVIVEAARAGVSIPGLYGFSLVNGVQIDTLFTNIVTAFPAYQSISTTLSLGALSLNDLVEVYISIQCTPAGATYAYCKDIEIYLS